MVISLPSISLTWPQLRLLQLIYEPFVHYAQWPVFQHVNAIAWHEIDAIGQEPREPREVYYDLSAFGLVKPPVTRERTFDLRDDTVIRLTLLGLTHVNDSIEDVGNLVNALRYIGERAYNFRPSSPTTPEDLRVTSEEIRLTLKLNTEDRGLIRLAHLLQEEARGIWSSFSGPDPGAGWSLTVKTDIARRYRAVVTASEILAVEDELQRLYAPQPKLAPTPETEEDRTVRETSEHIPRAFISYSHRDQEFVVALVEQLKRCRVQVWIDQAELVTGDSLITRIGDAISEGDFVVGVISPHSVQSSWCQKELALAITRGINEKRVTVLPVRLAEVEMPTFLTDVLYSEGDDPAAIADELTHAIETHLRRAGIEIAFAAETELRPAQATAGTVGSVPAADRRSTVAILDRIAERADEVLIQWDRCRRAGGALDDLVAEQRRLRTLLEQLPADVRGALPLPVEIAAADWQNYFRIRESASTEADLREELRAVRSQVERGLGVVPRWRIVGGPEEMTGHRRDAVAYVLTVARADETRTIAVYISRTAMASADEFLSADVVAAKTTRGRSVVVNLLSADEPPEDVMVSTEGVRWGLP